MRHLLPYRDTFGIVRSIYPCHIHQLTLDVLCCICKKTEPAIEEWKIMGRFLIWKK